MEDMYPLIKEMLEINGRATFKVAGWSMQPMIYNGRDTVTIVKPVFPLKKYDLPFYKMDDGQFYLHRVIEVLPDGKYNCQGDNRWEPETDITEDMIIGVVKEFNRNGKKYSVDSLGYRLYTHIWQYIHPLKHLYYMPKKVLSFAKNAFLNLKTSLKFSKKSAVLFKDGRKMDIKFRQANQSDMDSLYRLSKEYYLNNEKIISKDILDLNWFDSQDFAKHYQLLRKNGFCWIAENADEIIGFCCGMISKTGWQLKNMGNITDLIIKPQYGSVDIKKKFIDIFKDFCLSRSCNEISVSVFSQDTDAKEFYRSTGFSNYKNVYICKIANN